MYLFMYTRNLNIVNILAEYKDIYWSMSIVPWISYILFLLFCIHHVVGCMYIFILCYSVLFHWTTTWMVKIWIVHADDVNGWIIVSDYWHVNGYTVQWFKSKYYTIIYIILAVNVQIWSVVTYLILTVQYYFNKLSTHAVDDVRRYFH